MSNKTKYYGKKHFCRYYLQCFSRPKILEDHIKICLAIDHCLLKIVSLKNNFHKCQTKFFELNFKRPRLKISRSKNQNV